ncbi:MAG: M20/M25/M40 family metallo-hydrolase [Gammaproteobacteria bacterium]|nr:M20/M25/M40 family metallo-hydrolase [Gammaproteobacteria bacterium]
MKKIVILVLATFAMPALGDALNAEEQRMVEWIDTHTDDALALLKETVDIPSGTLNLQGVREVGVVMQRELDALGLETEWIEMPEEMKRAGHLFGRKSGSGKKILMIGHLDTVFEIEDGARPYESDGEVARGHGVYDMKAGNVIIIYALLALQEIGALDDIPLVVAYTGDEEKSGRPSSVSRKDLIEAGKWADIALGFEEAMYFDDTDWATVARRSSSRWVLTVEGKQSHSSDIFSETVGAGAIFEAARILDAFYNEVRGEPHLTFNAGTIQGGTEVDYDPQQNRGSTFGKTNVVPRKVVVHGGIRTISQDQLDRARAAMQAVVAQNHPHTSARIEFADGYPPMSPTDGNIALQQELSAINVLLGRKPMPALDPSRRGAADISYVAPHADALAGLGGIGGGGHTPDEYVRLLSMPLAIKRAAILIYRLRQERAAD